MTWLGRLFRRRALERDLDREVRFHIDAATDDLERAGMSRADARRTALLQFGGVEQMKEHARDARGTRAVEDFFSDIRHALRAMRRAPGLSLAAVLTLAIGIGANTSVWRIMDALMRRALPVERPEELYTVKRVRLGDNDGQRGRGDGQDRQVSYPTMQQMRAALPDSTRLAGMSAIVRLYALMVDQTEPVLAQLVSGDFFTVAGVRPQLGRLLTPSDARELGGAPVVVITDEFWERRFGRDRSVIGRRIRISGTPVTIVGVSHRGFGGLTVGLPVDVFIPLTMQHEVRYRGNATSSNADTEKPWIPQKGISWLTLIARLPSTEAPAAAARIEVPFHAYLVEELATRDSATRAFGLRERITLESIPLGFSTLRAQFGDPLRFLFAGVGLILLITCANLAGLLLARSAARTHETAVRVSLGAGPGRLIRQALTESLTLAVIAGAVGLGVAQWTTRVLLMLASTGTRPVPLDASIDARVVIFDLTVALAAGLLFGAAPAIRVARTDLYDSFRTGGRVVGGTGSHRMPLGRLLVMAQIALSLILVTSAGVFVRTFQNLVHVDVGYERERLVTARFDLRAAGYTADQLPALDDRLLAALRTIPGVQSASLSMHGIATGSLQTSNFDPPGRKLPPNDNSGQEDFVSADFFKTVGIQLVRGRTFNDLDTKASQLVVIVSQSAARKFLGTDSVVGAHFGYGSSQPWIIVGVVRDARVNSFREAPPPMIFHPLSQAPELYVSSAAVRVAGNPTSAIAGVRGAIASVSRTIPVRDVTPMELLLERGLIRERMVARLAAGFGILALLLAAIGLYGVISYSVARRTNEMGVRLALGASPVGVAWVVLRDSLATIALGLGVGLLLWFPLLGFTTKLLFGLSAHDPTSLGAGVLLLLVAGLLAALHPAVRAARIDPIDAIRAE
jgi:predicted permease